MELLSNNQLPFVFFETEDGKIRLRATVKDETIWLTQKMIAELYDIDRSVIAKHLKNIFQDQELEENSVCAKFAQTASDGKNYTTNFYNLDAIISVGYRINSQKATQFRIWATRILKEFITKGFVLDDERLKQGEQAFKQDYFHELLERVRSIRASERRIYQQITDIFAECCIDYDSKSEITHNFYAMVQNKFHFAITGFTAAEIIYEKSDNHLLHMGLSTWKNSPTGRILASDVTIAKNYLNEKEIKRLERTVSGFFDYIERIIEDEIPLTMQNMADSIDKFLTFNNYKILDVKGRISKKDADQKALEEYKVFNQSQKIESNFDKLIKSSKKLIKKK